MPDKLIEFRTLQFIFPEDNRMPIQIKWINTEKGIYDEIKVQPKDELSLLHFVREIHFPDPIAILSAITMHHKKYPITIIPIKWYEELNKPKKLHKFFNGEEILLIPASSDHQEK